LPRANHEAIEDETEITQRSDLFCNGKDHRIAT
jgi:hypothetical protein